MLNSELFTAIDAAVPGQVTHVGFVATNNAGDFLITEPRGHPYGVSATFSKVGVLPGEPPHETLERCLREQVGASPVSVYPIPVVWSTAQSRGVYFVGLLEEAAMESSPAIASLRWRPRAAAEEALARSQNQASRQRDLGILSAAAAICASPYRRVLLMLRELHLMGFERLRAPAYLYPIAWRCPIVPASWTQREHGGLAAAPLHLVERVFALEPHQYTYTSASGQQPFGWKGCCFATPRELALRFVRERREIALAGWGPDPAYARWLEHALELTAPNGLFYATSEFEPAADYLYAWNAPVDRVPLPPPGLADRQEWQGFAERSPAAF